MNGYHHTPIHLQNTKKIVRDTRKNRKKAKRAVAVANDMVHLSRYGGERMDTTYMLDG